MSTLVDPVTEALHQGLYTRVIGRRVVAYQRLGSTMDEAARLAEAAADDGTVVVAEEQTGGRGRFQRAWVSPPGNLYLSVVLRPSAGEAAYLGIIAALAVVRAVGRVTGRVPSIRWPNDVMM
ncbi:MAG: biotin--[acetyl-CoA-carboxylase] ligase, partial [Dehalococcoidia bacterium]